MSSESNRIESGQSSPGRQATILVVGVGTAVASTGIHGFAHVSIPVPTPGLQAVYVAIVLFGLPVTAAVLARRGRVRIGAWLALLAGVGAVLVLASAWVLWGHAQGRPATAVRSSTR